MKKNQKGFLIPLIIGIVAVFFIAGGAYVYFINRTPAEINIPSTATSTSTSNTSTSTADQWKTFGSIPYGFSIMHPISALISNSTSTNGHIFSFNTSSGIVTVEVATKANHDGKISSPPTCEDSASSVAKTNTVINGEKFVTMDMSKELSEANVPMVGTEYCLLKKDTAYKITTSSATSDKNPILNSMVSSFKLLNKPSTNPTITSVNPSSVALLSGFTITGSNFDPVGGSNSEGWLTHSHVFVLITNSAGKRAILWEGGARGGKTSTATKIVVSSVPKTICSTSSTVRATCPTKSIMELTPGKYTIQVSVNGRNTGNQVPLTITRQQ